MYIFYSTKSNFFLQNQNAYRIYDKYCWEAVVNNLDLDILKSKKKIDLFTFVSKNILLNNILVSQKMLSFILFPCYKKTNLRFISKDVGKICHNYCNLVKKDGTLYGFCSTQYINNSNVCT